MILKDTVEMMISEDYKERFKAEYYQLKIRHHKLDEILRKWAEGKLPFTPACSKGLLSKQLVYMEWYLRTLEKRAEIEGIEL